MLIQFSGDPWKALVHEKDPKKALQAFRLIEAKLKGYLPVPCLFCNNFTIRRTGIALLCYTCNESESV